MRFGKGWQIGDYPLPHPVSANTDNYPEITINCLAKVVEGDPRHEMELFQGMAVRLHRNQEVLGGGYDLQTLKNKNPIPITDGINQWYGHVLDVTFIEDDMSKEMTFYQINLIVIEKKADIYQIVTEEKGDECNSYDDLTNAWEGIEPAMKVETQIAESEVSNLFTETIIPKENWSNFFELYPGKIVNFEDEILMNIRSSGAGYLKGESGNVFPYNLEDYTIYLQGIGEFSHAFLIAYLPSIPPVVSLDENKGIVLKNQVFTGARALTINEINRYVPSIEGANHTLLFDFPEPTDHFMIYAYPDLYAENRLSPIVIKYLAFYNEA